MTPFVSRAAALTLALLTAPVWAQPAAPPATPAPAAPPATPAAAVAARPRPTDLKGRIEALEARLDDLAAAAAESGTTSAAVQELAVSVTALEQALAAQQPGPARADLVARGDELERRVAATESELNAVATRLGAVEQPAASAGGGVAHERGIALTTGDGRYRLTIGGYVQPRLEASIREGGDTLDAATFRLRRARLIFSGALGPRLGFKVMLDGRDPATTLLDAYADVALGHGLSVRVGQAKVPFTRSWITSSSELDFLERPAGLDNLRYDRDAGVWLRGALMGGRVGFVVGASNGGGKNTLNDNIDFVIVARGDVALRGERFDGYGDLERGHDLRLMVGVGGAHDLARLPERVGGIEVAERDVDDDGLLDNVGVASFSADLAARWCGFELAVEGYLRQERWGTILDHSSNDDLRAAVDPSSDGRRLSGGGFAELSYVPAPGWLLVAARVAQTRLSLLGVGGQVVPALPPAAWLQELDLTAHLIEDGARTLGLAYTLLDHDSKDGAAPAADEIHRFIVEYQWRL